MPETWLAQFDRTHSITDLDLPLILLICAARNRIDHDENGAPLLSENEIRLGLLEERAAAREQRRRADAGDQAAVAACVREAAELELLIDEAKERNRIEYARLCALDA
jgi:hypothetical protein